MSGVIQAVFQNSIRQGPPYIGQAFHGGFYAGKIAVGGGGVATHYLIVAPKATGESYGSTWRTSSTTTGIVDVINGSTNSAALAAIGASYEAATFCEGLSIGGYTDWYLPAKNELEVLYYFLKPGTTANYTLDGSNANAVYPEPISTPYTAGNPAQTSAGIGFRVGETNCFELAYYWSSTESSTTAAMAQLFDTGNQTGNTKTSITRYTRAVRKVAI